MFVDVRDDCHWMMIVIFSPHCAVSFVGQVFRACSKSFVAQVAEIVEAGEF